MRIMDWSSDVCSSDLRDGKVCQYTGRYVPNGTIDHSDPRSKGGENTWENMVWSDAEINALKGSMTLEEFERKHGYKLRRRPATPKKLGSASCRERGST